MASLRKAYRERASDALAGLPRFEAFARLKAWDEQIDAETLPVFGAFTLRDQMTRTTLDGEFQWDADLTVIAKRAGGQDLEDDLDDDLEAIASAVMGALHNAQIEGARVQCSVSSSQTLVNADGRLRVGTVAVVFTCRCFWIF